MAQSNISEPALTRVLLALWSQPQTTPLSLAHTAAISEAHVLEALTILQHRQCLIEQTPDGIALIQTGLPCWRDIIQARHSPLGSRTLIFQQTASTNDACWQHAADPAAHGLVVLADEQTAGRGRRGAAWLSKPGQSILLSILLRDLSSANIDTLTLQLGLATAQAVEQIASVDTAIKWPNDVLLQERKVAGVLVESRPGSRPNQQHVVLGIGLNVTQSSADFPQELRTRATSIYQATGRVIDRLAVIMTLLQQIESLCLSPMPAEQWLPAWKSRCPALGRSISARTANAAFIGQLLDIDPYHGLVLLESSGSRHFLSARTTTLVP